MQVRPPIPSRTAKRANTQRLKALDLFSGCGGLTAGLKRAGFDVVAAVELDPVAAETYKANHPNVHLWNSDICKLKATTVKRKLNLRKGELDLLAGCPPCQGFSTMRTLNGKMSVDDPQNRLLLQFLRFVEELRPKAAMMENVPGLASDRRFKHFCTRLKELGYSGQFRVLNAADYGVPQRRRRLIYVASNCGIVPFAEPNTSSLTVRDAIGKLRKAGRSGDPVHDFAEHRSKRVLNLIKAIPRNGGSRTDLPKQKQLGCHRRCDGFKDVYGRMAWNSVAPTITSGCFNPSKGRFLHPTQHRAVTLREAALLQGFPGRYRFDVRFGKSALALMIGNALPPPFIAAHARKIRSVLEHNQPRKSR